VPAPAPAPAGFVDLATLEPGIAIDMRYAGADNFTGEAIYPVARCLLRRPVAEALVRVERRLRRRGFALKVWDCYRPFSVQEQLWRRVPDPRYVARPRRDAGGRPIAGSKHNRGAAVDLTLITAAGSAVEMPTDHDDFSRRAHRGSPRWSPAARRHAEILDEAMLAERFAPIPTEWWHYDGARWREHPLADVPLQ
jgi:beta-N-acetylhexosaminidase/D-alanyl-D-alanine dipeptidase